MWAGDINTTHQNCKQCALIAVYEILNTEVGNTVKGYEYWQEVKKEIQIL
jgi:hypothetical protein